MKTAHTSGTYKLTADFALSHHTAPMRGGCVVRDINMAPNDSRLPDVAICRVFSSRDDAEKILAALQSCGA
jgi:hypothetical protein